MTKWIDLRTGLEVDPPRQWWRRALGWVLLVVIVFGYREPPRWRSW